MTAERTSRPASATDLTGLLGQALATLDDADCDAPDGMTIARAFRLAAAIDDISLAVGTSRHVGIGRGGTIEFVVTNAAGMTMSVFIDSPADEFDTVMESAGHQDTMTGNTTDLVTVVERLAG